MKTYIILMAAIMVGIFASTEAYAQTRTELSKAMECDLVGNAAIRAARYRSYGATAERSFELLTEYLHEDYAMTAVMAAYDDRVQTVNVKEPCF